MACLKRNELYKDLWSRPCTKIAADLGISSSALKKICVAMNIPTPPVGHWTRVECGKEVKKAKLPKANDDTRLEWDIDLENSKRQRSPRTTGPTPKEKESFPDVPIAIDLSSLHPLVKATRAQLL